MLIVQGRMTYYNYEPLLQILLCSLQATRVTRTNRSDVLATEFASPSSTCVTARRTAQMVMTRTPGSALPVGTEPWRGEMEPAPFVKHFEIGFKVFIETNFNL
jgi:hypothetical protein